MKEMNTQDKQFWPQLTELLAFETAQDPKVDETVAQICAQVKQKGDAALLEYTARFDGLSAKSMADLTISKDELKSAFDRLEPELQQALKTSAERIKAYHERQKQTSWTYTDETGTLLGQQVTPLDKVGIYVPGGKAAYPSSVLMNAVPAQVAGVNDIIMVVPTPNGERNDLVLAAAYISGVTTVYAIGGAQAVAALAYGTETITQVDKITGPGNAYVAAAKRRVFGIVGIDMVAGPSEILVIADGSTPADWVAMDLFSQAEHDEIAQSILITTSQTYLDEIKQSIAKLLPTMPRKDIIQPSLEGRGALILAKDLDEACEIANYIAPEHLELSVQEPEKWTTKIINAGAIFMGKFTSESLGDYCAGPNHVLPTSRTARFASPLGVYDFQKRSSLIQVSEEGAQVLGKIAQLMATGEGLYAHAQSAHFRLKK